MNKFNGRYLLVILAIVMAIAMCLLTWWAYLNSNIVFPFGKDEMPKFGSYFGGVTGPLLSLLSFIVILISLMMQNYELIQAREGHQRQIDMLQKQLEISIEQDKKTLTMNVHERWSRSDLYEIRNFISGYLLSLDQPMEWDEIKKSHHAEFSKFVHILQELSALIRHQQVHVPLINALMKDTILYFLGLFRVKVIYNKPEDINWMEENVFVLEQLLES